MYSLLFLLLFMENAEIKLETETEQKNLLSVMVNAPTGQTKL